MKPIKLITCFAVASLFFFSAETKAQDTLPGSWINISEVNLVRNISNSVSSVYADKETVVEKDYGKLKSSPGLEHKRTVPPRFISKKVILTFNICNNSDSISSVYFSPGLYYQSTRLYIITRNGLKPIPPVFPPISDGMGFQLLTLAAHDSISILAELAFVKTHIVTIRPWLLHPQYISSFMTELRATHNQDNILTYIFSGLLLMMILFSMANYFQGGNREFLYYSGYAFFLGSMLFTKAAFDYRISELSFFLESYLDFILQALGIMFYMIFMQRFIDTRSKHPFLHKLYNTGIGLLVSSMLFYSVLHYFSDNFVLQNIVENVTKLLLLVMTVIFLVYSGRLWKDKLLRYLFWGNLCLFIFSVVSLLTIMFDSAFKQFPGIFNSSLFYYELGLFLELVFFLAGLNYKNRRSIIVQTREREALKAQNQLQEYEKEIAVYKAQQEERERISADMHDELGSGMTAIRLMSEIARNKMKENTPVEIERISQSANDVLNKMNAIIWSMNSGNDTLDNLVYYIRGYSLEYFENTPIHCSVHVPEKVAPKEISGDKRRNVFLCVKETLNNALKHSGASAITIDIQLNHQLVISIADNGKGIDMQQLRQFGNGLRNIAKRMESIGGTFKIETHNGTVTKLELPV